VQRITGETASELIANRMAFVATHERVLERVRARAEQVDAERALLARQREAVADQEAVLKRRRADLKDYAKELAESRAETAKAVAALEEMSQKLFDYRVLLQKTEEANVRDHNKIVDLEKQVRQLDGSSRPSRSSRD